MHVDTAAERLCRTAGTSATDMSEVSVKASVTTAAANNEQLTGKFEPAGQANIQRNSSMGLQEAKPSVKARVISVSRDYLTVEFERGQQIDFEHGQIVSVSK